MRNRAHFPNVEIDNRRHKEHLVIPTSLSAAAAEAHINDLLADAETARRVRLARRATVDRSVDVSIDGSVGHRGRQPRREANRGLAAWRATSAAVRTLVVLGLTGHFSRTATVSTPTEGDA
jgi:hypothetical protein